MSSQDEMPTSLPFYHIGGASYFGYRMVLASRLFDRRIIELLKEHGPLNLPEWRVISQLGLQPEGTVRSLAEGAAVDRAEVSRVMRQLEGRGLALRRINPADQRSPQFSLTPEGQALYRRVRAPISDFIAHLTDGFSDEDIAVADNILNTITTRCNPSGSA